MRALAAFTTALAHPLVASCGAWGRGPGRRSRIALALAVTLPMSACNSYSFYLEGPNFRGITVPLPPPSFRDVATLRVEIEGTLPGGQEDPDAIAYVYDVTGERGYFTIVEPDGRTFVVHDVLVDPLDNCFAAYVELNGEQTDAAFFEVVLRDGDEACADSLCSAQDDEGTCLCVDPWSLPCS